jgi:hypothetical protein
LQCKVRPLTLSTIMRVLFSCVAFLVLAAPTPQGSVDLRARYGEPDVQRFGLRPDITVTVEYGSDQKACILEIEPRQAFIRGRLPQMKTISKEQMLQLLDEVAPPRTRGIESVPLFSNDFASGGQCMGHGTFGQYANVNISLSYIVCDPPMGRLTTGVQSARVQFNRPACESLNKWNSQ